MDKLAAGRAAFAAHDWVGARDAFLAARETTALAADDLHALAEASWWLGLMDESQAARKEAYDAYLEASDNRHAAMRAVDIAYAYFLRGDGSVGSGWVNRAQRLVQDEPDCPEQGFLLYLAVETSLDGGAETLTKAREVQAFGRRHADHNLIAAGLVAEGRVLIKLGRAQEGVALLDEGMLEASSEKLLPNWAGNIYCHLMAACYELGDIRRATAWTQSTSEWCDRMAPAVLFKGICRVHRAQVMQIRGAWEQAQDEAERICQDAAHIHIGIAAEAHYQIGEIRRLRGDLDGAEAAYGQGHELGRDPQPGLALLRLAQRRADPAAVLIRSALAGVTDRLTRARLLAAQVEIAIAANDMATASSAADELDAVADAYQSSGLQAAAKRCRGAVLLASGQTEDALSTLRDACSGWSELEAPYDCAKVRVLLAQAYRELGDTESSDRELAAARATFEALGAELDASLGVGEPGAALPNGLTEREATVLALAAEGSTNRQIAEALLLSPKTVERHLSNIFTKLDVTTRTAAARFAFEHGIASPRDG